MKIKKHPNKPASAIYIPIVAMLLLIFSLTQNAIAQTNTVNETVSFHVSGNCNMCKKNIESAAKGKGVVKAEWNRETKVITVEYDPAKADLNKVKKRIAGAGYDNDGCKADDTDYDALHGCCKYERGN